MTVELRQMRGFQSDGVEVELPQDEILLTGKEYPVPKRVGYALREKGAAINLIVPVSESDAVAIRKAVAERDGDDSEPDKRKVSVAPPVQARGGK